MVKVEGRMPVKTKIPRSSVLSTPYAGHAKTAGTPGALKGIRLGVIREANGMVVVLDGFTRTDFAEQLKKFREECLFADLEIVLDCCAMMKEHAFRVRSGAGGIKNKGNVVRDDLAFSLSQLGVGDLGSRLGEFAKIHRTRQSAAELNDVAQF